MTLSGLSVLTVRILTSPSKGKLPKSKLNYWRPKIEQNKDRDARNIAKLEAAGWQTLVVWQCEIVDGHELWLRLQEFLER